MSSLQSSEALSGPRSGENQKDVILVKSALKSALRVFVDFNELVSVKSDKSIVQAGATPNFIEIYIVLFLFRCVAILKRTSITKSGLLKRTSITVNENIYYEIRLSKNASLTVFPFGGSMSLRW